MKYKYNKIISYKIIVQAFISFSLTACGENNSDSISNNEAKKCDAIINKSVYDICYDYNLKSALFVTYTLDGSLVDNPNISDRPSFYKKSTIAQKYQSDYDDYTGSGYDRGHLAYESFLKRIILNRSPKKSGIIRIFTFSSSCL